MPFPQISLEQTGPYGSLGGREELSRKVALFTAGVVKSLRRFLKIVARVCSRCQVDCSDPSPKNVTTRLILEKVRIPSNVRFDRKDCQRFWSAKFGFSNGVWNVVLLIILIANDDLRALLFVTLYVLCILYRLYDIYYYTYYWVKMFQNRVLCTSLRVCWDCVTFPRGPSSGKCSGGGVRSFQPTANELVPTTRHRWN